MEPVFTPLRGEDRQAKARANKAAGYRCSQQISCSFAEDLGEDMERLIRLGMPFGSGMGRGQVCGCVVGAMLVGFSEVFVSAIGLSVWRDAVVFLLLIIVLIVRPTGIFGRTMSEKV